MTEAVAVGVREKTTPDVDQEEIEETLTLDQRKEELKKSRWNVFLWLGVHLTYYCNVFCALVHI